MCSRSSLLLGLDAKDSIFKSFKQSDADKKDLKHEKIEPF
jgi:hypothetical protein